MYYFLKHVIIVLCVLILFDMLCYSYDVCNYHLMYIIIINVLHILYSFFGMCSYI
jgi:hypothetical protein